MVSFALVASSGEPSCVQDAINGKGNNSWIATMPKEIESPQKKVKLCSIERRIYGANGSTGR
jgi:hypothetical protein